MKMKQLALGVSALLVAGSAAAEFSANIGATSNYVWRGLTQTGDDAAISGGLDYAHDSGLYAGTWASSLGGGGATGELDFYGGYAGEAGALGYDVGVIYYAYPNGGDINFTEIYGSVSYSLFTVGVNYTIDSEVNDTAAGGEFALDGDVYYFLGASYEVMPTWTLGGTIGVYDFEDDGQAGVDMNYTHYQLDITKSAGDYGDFTLSVSGVDDQNVVTVESDAKVFVTWGKTF